ncbi:MAG: transporter [Chitinophagales bacterium]|nr:transporter [Chitinophagales bacterium]
MKKIIALIAFLSLVAFGFAQDNMPFANVFKSKIETTDRGAFTKTGNNIKKGLQVEIGLDYEWTDSYNTVFKTDVFSPFEGKIRLGLNKYIEVDFAISHRQIHLNPWDDNGSFPEKSYSYWTPLEIGLRTQFIDSKQKSKTDASLYLALSVNNTMRSAYREDGTFRPDVLIDRPSYVTPEIALFVNHNIGERVVLGYNAGIRWTGIEIDGPKSAKNPNFVYTLRILAHVSEKMDLYGEHFNSIRVSHSPSLGMNIGARYGVSQKLTVDLNGGVGFNTSSPDGFAGLGLSYKLGK